jgi:hypothetical protein
MSEHGRNGYLHGCRCDVCRAGQRECIAAQRARRRALRPVAPLPTATNVAPTAPDASDDQRQASDGATNAAPGPCVAAVRADIAGLGELRGYQWAAACAVAMAQILDGAAARSVAGDHEDVVVEARRRLANTLRRQTAPGAPAANKSLSR